LAFVLAISALRGAAPVAKVTGVTGTAAPGVTLAWDANPVDDRVTGYKALYGNVTGVYTVTADVGNVTTASFTLPDGDYYFAVLAYRDDPTATPPHQESTPSTEVHLALQSRPDCVAPLGANAVSVFITKKEATTGAVGSRERLNYQLGSPGSPVVAVQPLLNGLPAGPGIRGVDLTADGGIWFPTPSMPGTYALSLTVTNAAGCTAMGNRDAAGRDLSVVVK
jgi:hypothetical protein